MFGLLFACCILLVELLIIYPRVQFGLLCKVHSDIHVHRKHIGWNPLNSVGGILHAWIQVLFSRCIFPATSICIFITDKIEFFRRGGGSAKHNSCKRPCLQHTSIHAAITIEAFNTSLLSPHLYIYCDTCTSLTSDPTLAIILKSLNVYSLHSEIPPIYI